MQTNHPPDWLGPDCVHWQAEVHTWLSEIGKAQGWGDIQALTTLKARPWSAVLRVRYHRRCSYFKACAANGRHEPALLQMLGKTWPHALPVVLASDMQRGWLLLADAGSPLDAGNDAGRLAILSHYAQMQIASLQQCEGLLALGLPDRRLTRLPALLNALCEGPQLLAAEPLQDLAALRCAIAAQLPTLAQDCEQLTASPIALALERGDLHPGNMFAGDGHFRLGDWGDACLTHPFASLTVLLERVLPIYPPSAQVIQAERLLAHYLAPWQAVVPRVTLQPTLQKMLSIAHVLRALDYAHMFQGGDQASNARWLPLIAKRLDRWLQHEALLRRGDTACIFAMLATSE